ncbi:MAG: tetratricopeptide repeat protein, partial [Coleofasciculaceae cyanobacterium]
MVQLAQLSEVEMNVHLVLDDKPTRTDQKLKTLSNYVQQYPSGWKKRLKLADLLYQMGRWPEAVEEYRQVLGREPCLIEVRLQMGKILHLTGKDTEAIAVYEEASSLCHNAATKHHLEGLIELYRDRPLEAVKRFESAASIEPSNPAHWHALGQVYQQTESPVATLRAFDVALSLNPNDVVALSKSYQPLLAVGEIKKARQRLEQALKLSPNDCRTLQQLATHRCQQGLVAGEEGKQTKQLIKTALALAPDSATAHQVLSLYHLGRGEWDKAVAVLLKFTEEHPKSPIGWYHYARCLFQTGNSHTAADAILKAYNLYQKDCEIYRALCEILPTAGRLEEFRINSVFARTEQEHQPVNKTTTPPTSLIEEMLDRFPQRWSVWVTAGRVLVEHYQDIEGGCRVSELAVQLQPNLADAWFLHGRVLALAGRHREATDALERGWQSQPKGYLQLVSAAVWLGESYRVLGDEPKSRKCWEQACERA